VAVLLFGVPLALAVGRLYRSQQLTRLERTATAAVGRVSAVGLPASDPIELPRVERGTHLAVYDRAGRRVAGTGPQSGGRTVTSALSGRVTQGAEADQLIAAVPVVDEEQVVAATRAAAPLDLVEARTHRTWLLMAALGVGAIGAAALIGNRQARRLGAPVAALAATASLLGEGDFAARAARSGIAELDSAAAALDQTAVRLGDLVDRERAFTADASHQLRTRLTALRLTLEAALETPGADLRGAIEAAVTEADRLEATVVDLLALARDVPGARATVDLDEVVREVESRWHGPLAAAGRPLRTRIDRDLPPLVASTAAILHVLEILLDNASRHGAGAVTVSLRRTGNGMVIDVADEGPGILGDPTAVFARRSPSEHGDGIGLALARSLAAAEGGELVLRATGPHPVFSLLLSTGRRDPLDVGGEASAGLRGG
jgi:signal transduction histidine kinase